MSEPQFTKETDLCAAFIACLPDGWTAYPETGGFDILLVRADDGFQIGVEAKLRLNAKVIEQAMEGGRWHHSCKPGPDCRAVLVPEKKCGGLRSVCAGLGITVIGMRDIVLDDDGKPVKYGVRGNSVLLAGRPHEVYSAPFLPELPEEGPVILSSRVSWFERCPDVRVALPDFVPDVVAGAASPIALTAWKVKAIKIVVTLEKRGYITRRDFKHHQISMSVWIQPHQGWLIKDGDGAWTAGPNLPDFRKQHPVNFGQIEAEYETWKSPEEARQRGLFAGKHTSEGYDG